MTATLKENETVVEQFPSKVLSRGYSDAELNLIKMIWTDTKEVAQSKMQLCIHLYELKQELDNNDPSAGKGNNGQSRFWAAFEQGDLPEYVTNSPQRTREWLQAAEFVSSGEMAGAPANSLLALTPSTVCNLSRIAHPTAEEIAVQHLRDHDFIGHDAASWLSRKDLDGRVLDLVQEWCNENPDKALVPSVIRRFQSEIDAQQARLERSKRVAEASENIKRQVGDAPTVDVSQIGRTPDELEFRRKQKEVDDILDASDAEKRSKLQRDYQDLAEAFTKCDAALQHYASRLNNIVFSNGSDYLDDLRAYRSPLTGFNPLEHDISIISEQWVKHITKIRDTLLTRQGPSKVNFDDPNLVTVEAIK